MKRHLTALLTALFSLTLTAALAGGLDAAPQGQMHHTMPGQMHGPMDMQAMNDMMVAQLRPLRGQAFDRQWTELMIGHHQMALNMAAYELKNGTDARVKANAQQVLNTQQREIDQMRGWLKTWGAPAPMQMDGQMTVSRTGQESADRWFTREMIPHHQGAIDMARLAPARTWNPQLLKLAASIIKAQQAEINQYRQWLKVLP